MDRKTMKAAVFEGNGVLSLKEVPVPKIRKEDDVLLQVEAVSICGSDLHILNVPPGQYGRPGTIMGHEFVARVREIGEGVSTVQAGDRVVAEPNIQCGVCPECKSGHGNLCRNAQNTGQWRDGGFAGYCVLPEKQLHLVPKELPAKAAALAEPLACVMNGIIKLAPMPYEKIVLFGAGAIGLIFLRVLKRFGIRHIAVGEMDPVRRQEAEKLGASYVFNPGEQNWMQALEEQWGTLADAVIDAVGAGAVFEQAVDIVTCGGRILIFGQNMTQHSTIQPGNINRKEITVLASLSTKFSFPPAIELLSDPALGLEQIVTHEFPLSEIEKGLQLMRSKQAQKVVLYPQE